jgi:hypothetical protein
MTARETNASRLLMLPWPSNGDLRSFNEARGWQVYRVQGSKIEHCAILGANSLDDDLSEVLSNEQLPIAFASAEMGLLPSQSPEKLAELLNARITQDRRNSEHPLAGLQAALVAVTQPEARLAVA